MIAITNHSDLFINSPAHGAVCLEPGILLDVLSPAREGFLAKAGEK